jgi:hypothetical protein
VIGKLMVDLVIEDPIFKNYNITAFYGAIL